jgi:hypothetical protein
MPTNKNSTGSRSTVSDGANNSSRITPKAVKSLAMSLPVGWQRFYTPRRAGKGWGFPIRCRLCGETAPPEVNKWNKWRWTYFHRDLAHTGK